MSKPVTTLLAVSSFLLALFAAGCNGSSSSQTNSPPSVTTTSLPDAIAGTFYSFALQASGGTAAYTWTISTGTLPSWAQLDSASGIIWGMPDAEGTTNFSVTVTDVKGLTGAQDLSLKVKPAVVDSTNNAALKGQYAFLLQGYDDATGSQFAIVGSFVADGNGKVTGGLEDINGPDGYKPAVSFTGSYNVGGDRRGTSTFKNSLGKSTTFAIAVGSLDSSNVATRGSLIEFDDTDGKTGRRGSGFIYQQNVNKFHLTDIVGPYAFQFVGQTEQTGTRLALTGAYSADGNGNITNGKLDGNANGQMEQATFTGKLSADANTASFGRVMNTPDGVPRHFVYYLGTDERSLAMSTDSEATAGLVAGEVLAQRSAPYSAASLHATSVGYGVGKVTLSMGLWTFDGSATADYSLFWTNHDYASFSLTPETGSLSYAVEANGRVTTAGGSVESGVPGAPIFYLVDANKGFLVSTDASVSTGMFEPQTGGPFSNASLSGNYFLGTVSPAKTTSGVVSGVGASTGGTIVSLTIDWSDPFSILKTLPDSWLDIAIGPDGFGEPRDPFSSSSPVYVISPGKFVVMESDFPSPMMTIYQR